MDFRGAQRRVQSYYTWVDQHNTLGLGENVPMSTANLMAGLVALKDGEMISLRVPYPIFFVLRWPHRRSECRLERARLVDDERMRTPWLMEGGKGSRPRAVHIQMRPDPLAK